MPQILQATKITRNGRISLGHEAMECLGAKVGDRVKLFEQGGFVWLIKEDVPEVSREAKGAAADV